MKTTKMSLANIQGKLSRTEMKKIMAGSGTCQAKVATGGGSWVPIIGLSSSEAQNYPGMTNWCCDSCSSTSWAVH